MIYYKLLQKQYYRLGNVQIERWNFLKYKLCSFGRKLTEISVCLDCLAEKGVPADDELSPGPGPAHPSPGLRLLLSLCTWND